MRSTSRSFSRRALARTYGWVAAWLGAAAVLALLLLANSIRSYLSVWRILAVQQVRQELSRQAVVLEQAFRREAVPPPSASAALAQLSGNSSEKPLWIEMRMPDGTVLAREGIPSPGRFSSEDESAAFRNHQSLYRVLGTPGGEAVAEVFALRVPLPGLAAPAPPQGTTRPPGRRPPLMVEIAAPLLVKDPSVLWHIRRDLLVNCSGAIALLATVVISGLGFRSYARGRWLESQLEIARQVQSELLPSRAESFGSVRLAAVYGPAEQVSGDFYDAFQTGDGLLAVVMGDVSGKGVPAALVTGVVHGAVRVGAWSASADAHERESARLNELLCEKASVSRHVSLFWCTYEPATRRLRYVNAGHNPPLLVRSRGGEVEMIPLEQGGPVLGLIPTARYLQADHEVCPGDVLVLYSDGLVEATNRAGEEYGEGRLRDSLGASPSRGPEEIRDGIMASASAFVGGQPYRDDVTLLVAKFA